MHLLLLVTKEEPPPPPPLLGFRDKLKIFFSAHWAGMVAVFTPIFFLPIILASSPIQKHSWCGYCLCVMAAYWMTECIPLPITSFIPLIVFPLTNIMDTATTCACYVNDTIFMFLGSLMMAACVEQSGYHVRLALWAIRSIGYSHRRLLFAISYITMFVSMWLTNTAATTMMVPITFAILRVFEGLYLLTIYDTNKHGELQASDITTCYFCCLSYSATIGGIGTLVGTGTNLVFKGHFLSSYPLAGDLLSFPTYSFFSIPMMLVLETAVYLFMIVFYFGFGRPRSASARAAVVSPLGMEAAKLVVLTDSRKLGSITYWEIMVIILFGGAMVLFFSRSPGIFVGWGDRLIHFFGLFDLTFIKDSALAMLIAYLMMLLPASPQFFQNFKVNYREHLPQNPIKSVLDWKKCHETLPWSFAFLLGGGFALSEAAKAEYSNLNGKLGEFLTKLGDLSDSLILLFVVAFTVFVTNFASNVATCNVVTPIAMQMMLAGSIPTLTTILITWIFLLLWAPIVWGAEYSSNIPRWLIPIDLDISFPYSSTDTTITEDVTTEADDTP